MVQVGTLLEDRLGLTDEGGAAFEIAFESGESSRDLLYRVFRHHQRTGQHDRGLEVVDGLLRSASDASELATLWTARGQILVASGHAANDAVEAFDMALSYEPGSNEARLGLADALAQLGDWDQLLQVLEAISDSGTPAERATALLRMAAIAQDRLGQPARATDFLRAAVAAAPSADSVARLEALVRAQEPGGAEHIDLLGQRVAFGPPWYPVAVELGRLLLASESRVSWAILSPLLMIRGADEAVKAQLREMRRDHERPPMLVVDAARVDAAWDDADLVVLRDVLSAVEQQLSLVALVGGDLGTAEVSDVSPHSTIGRSFHAVAERLGVGEIGMVRAGAMRVPVGIARVDGALRLAVRADVFQQMARAEVGFVLGMGAELARPGRRLVGGLAAPSVASAIVGLLASVGLRDASTSAATAVADAIRAAFDDDTRTAWAARLQAVAGSDPSTLAARYVAAVEASAHRVAFLAGADLYQVSRLLARLDAGTERPAVFGTIEQFDELLAGWPELAALLVFASSGAFRDWVRNAHDVAGS